jgi:hypothetical protein
VIKAKTASCSPRPAEVGAMVAGRNGPERVALESFGMNLGIAFQLVDDALDYAGREAKLGKTVGDDFREGKITLPVILAFLRGGAVDREFWKRTIEKLDQRDGDLAQAQSLIERHNALADTLERARHYGAMARDALGLFRDSPLKSALLEAWTSPSTGRTDAIRGTRNSAAGTQSSSHRPGHDQHARDRVRFHGPAGRLGAEGTAADLSQAGLGRARSGGDLARHRRGLPWRAGQGRLRASGSPASASPTSARPPWCGTAPPASRCTTPSSGRTAAPPTLRRAEARRPRGDGAERTGLLLDPYFSGTKIAWILDRWPAPAPRPRRARWRPARSRASCCGA